MNKYVHEMFYRIMLEFYGKNFVFQNRDYKYNKINRKERWFNSDMGWGLIYGKQFLADLFFHFYPEGSPYKIRNFIDEKEFLEIMGECSKIEFVPTDDLKSGYEIISEFLSIIDDKRNEFIASEVQKHKGIDFYIIQRDFAKLIFEECDLEFKNITINSLFLRKMAQRFKGKGHIKFYNCKISEECDFSILRGRHIEFIEMTINFNKMSFSDNNYRFWRCKIFVEKLTKIYSEWLDFSDCEIDYKNFYFYSYAEKLQYLTIYNRKEDYDDADNHYNLLPHFCPNITNLTIYGRVNSLDFLYSLKRLDDVSVSSRYDMYDAPYIEITSETEVKKLLERNKKSLEIQKALIGGAELPNYIIGTDELNRIIKIIEFAKRLSYSQEEYYRWTNIFKEYKNIVDYFTSSDFERLDEGYYIFNGIRLRLAGEGEIEHNYFVDTDRNRLFIKNNMLVLGTNKRRWQKFDIPIEEDICIPMGKILFHLDGRPIVFQRGKTIKIETVEEAKDYYEAYGRGDRQYEEMLYDQVKEDVLYLTNPRNIYENGKRMTFNEIMRKKDMSIIYSNSMVSFFEITQFLEQNFSQELPVFLSIVKQYLGEKDEKNPAIMNDFFIKTIYDNIDKLNPKELYYLYLHFIDSVFNRKHWGSKLLENLDINIDMGDITLESISRKLNIDLAQIYSEPQYEREEYIPEVFDFPKVAVKELKKLKPRVAMLVRDIRK